MRLAEAENIEVLSIEATVKMDKEESAICQRQRAMQGCGSRLEFSLGVLPVQQLDESFFLSI